MRRGAWAQMDSWEPFPQRTFRKMIYEEFLTYQIGVVSTFGVENVWRLNSLFDPNLTGIGHQPYGYDQMTGQYRAYKVTRVDVSVEFMDPSADGLMGAALITEPSDPSVLFGASINAMMEKPNCHVVNVNDTGEQKVHFARSFTISELTGITANQLDANITDYTASTVASPVTVPKIHIAVASLDGAATTPTIRARIKLVYHAQFWDRVVLPQSV